jgi:hypothetical protein
MAVEFDRMFQPGALAHQSSSGSSVGSGGGSGGSGSVGVREEKNRYAFRNASNNDGFTRFVAPPKPEVVADVVDTTRRAEVQANSMIKKATAGGYLANNMMVVNVAKMALVGMVAGAVYGLAKSTAEAQNLLYELRYKTVAFDMDTFASQLFHRLGKYERLQSEAYKLAIHYCDKLFLLERSLTHPSARPSDTDIPMANACIDAVLGYIMLMRNHAENGEQRGEINIIKQSISEMLQDHRRRIHSRCATLRL